MSTIILHRNSQKRFYGPNKIYFITTNTDNRFPFFKEDLFCELFIDNLKICKKIKDFKLYGFIVIPDHIHLLLEPIGKFNISQTMQFLKRHFSRNANFILNNYNNNEGEVCYEEGEIGQSRLQEKYKIFENIINEHDKKLKEIKNKFLQKNFNDKFIGYEFKWQSSFYDHVIRDEEDFF
ncbi:MAG: transposase [Patescibacteria group bacterium]|nr:transposase [Patescibacteria group bacterium]